jgi:hypothetical protein
MQAASTDNRRRRRKLRRGSSLVIMLVISFVLVLLPLLVAIGIATVNVRRLSDEAAVALGRSSDLAEGSKLLYRDVREMERHTLQAAQFEAGSEELRLLVNAYHGRQERFDRRLTELLARTDDSEGRRQLRAMRELSVDLAEDFPWRLRIRHGCRRCGNLQASHVTGVRMWKRASRASRGACARRRSAHAKPCRD